MRRDGDGESLLFLQFVQMKREVRDDNRIVQAKPESACGACTSMHSTANVQRAAEPQGDRNGTDCCKTKNIKQITRKT